jgi:hypothetical protein
MSSSPAAFESRHNPTMVPRYRCSPRAVLLLAVAVSPVWAAGTRLATPFDSEDPIANLRLEFAMGCASTDPRAPQYYVWSGAVYGRRVGEPDRHLFDVQGVNPRACELHDDPRRGGLGYRATARELMLYLDPANGEVLRHWHNPWTDETVRVVHMANDPASMREPRFALDADGRPAAARMRWRAAGEQAWVSSRTSTFFRDSPLGGVYQDYVGGKYQVMEISSFVIATANLRGLRRTTPIQRIPYVATWTRISPWLPWMKMAGRDGQVVLVSQGHSTLRFEELPQPLRRTIENCWPLMKEAPPFDDRRPFQTSWDSLRRELDDQRERAPPCY